MHLLLLLLCLLLQCHVYNEVRSMKDGDSSLRLLVGGRCWC
jgi:hypothetical protein